MFRFNRAKKLAVLAVLIVLISCFSLAVEARFGGGGSHSSSHSSYSSHSYSSFHSYSSGGSSRSSNDDFFDILFKIFVFVAIIIFIISVLVHISDDQAMDDDETELIDFLRSHFMLMQRLWDNDDWAEISRHVSKEMLTILKKRRAETKSYQAEITEISQLKIRIKLKRADNYKRTIKVEFKGKDNAGYFTEDWLMTNKGKGWVLNNVFCY